jgi:cytochrome c-type biogenesis protein CcmH/NrfG
MRSRAWEIPRIWRKFFLTIAGVVALAVLVVVSVLPAPRVWAQAPEAQSAPQAADRPVFDVVTIKRNKSGPS